MPGWLTLIILCAVSPLAQGTGSVSDSDLVEITARGRFLAEYDAASWHATDAVKSLQPAQGLVSKYIARKAPTGWVVAFGRFSEAKDAFLIVYEASEGSSLREFTVKTYDPPRNDTDYFYKAAKAIELSLRNAQLQKRPYNTYVLPLDSGQFYVYVAPAQTVPDIYPLGGDTRFLISADGSNIVEARQLHKTILETKPSAPGGANPVAGVHSHVLTDMPEDTDVFHVLRQRHPLPEMIGTKSGVYKIDTDGTIKRLK